MPSIKVLLINPPFQDSYAVGSSRSIKKVQNIILPLGLAYLAAVLEQERIPVKIIDCSLGVRCQQLPELIDKEIFDIVGITSTTASINSAVLTAKYIRGLLPEAVIVLGGAHITAMPQELGRNGCFDVGVLGEAEETFLELVRHIDVFRLKELSKIKGIVFREGNNLVNTGPREFIRDLDKLPLPARHLLPGLEKYHPTPASYKRLPQGILITSRGCPCRCSFCDRAVFGNTVRLRSAASVLEEVEELVGRYKAREIRFFDDMFTFDKKRTYEICAGLRKRKIAVSWTCLTGVNFVDPDLLKAMKDAGCWQVLYGLESGSPEILKLLNKGNLLEQNIKAVRWAHQAGLSVRADFIVGTPGDSLEKMKRTLKFAIDMDLDYSHFNKFVPFPGTQLYRQLIQEGRDFDFTQPCSIIDHGALPYVPEGISKSDYKNFLDSANRKFYLRSKYIIKRLKSIETWDEFKGQVNGFLAIIGLG